MWNAALATAALHRVGLPLNSDNVGYGLSHVNWPGRFETILPGVILDGAHNPHAAVVLAATWLQRYPGKKAVLVFSAVGGKDIVGILEILAPLASHVLICPVDTPRAVTVEELAACLPDEAPPHQLFPTFDDAFSAARNLDAPILIAGSLFLVGEARAYLTGKNFQSSSQ